MHLNKIEDPRDNLERAHRGELVAYAQANGQNDITEDMPAKDIREKLRQRGLTRIQINKVPIGHIGRHEVRPLYDSKGKPLKSPAAPQINPAELAQFREWQRQQGQKPQEAGDAATMSMADLRKACKAKGIAMGRKDNRDTLREKLTAHG